MDDDTEARFRQAVEVRRQGIACPRCGRVSHHPRDVVQRSCGACHAYHEDLPATGPIPPEDVLREE